MSLPTDAKARKAVPLYSGVVRYFPRALIAVAQCSYRGNEQHHPGTPLHWDRSKSQDHLDCLMRHMVDDVLGVEIDTDETEHLTKCAWRALAALELHLERARRAAPTLSATASLGAPLPQPGLVVPVSSGPEAQRIPPPPDADE